MTNTTYSLLEVATELRLDTEMKDPVRWLTAQIKAGRITARRIGRSWRMTRADVDHALDVFASRPATSTAPAEHRGGPTAASMRRRLAAAS